MIVGQLVAGMLVGPFGLGLIRDTTAIDFLATLGIILLLFVVGLELDPRKFGKVGSRVLILSTVEFLIAFAVSILSALFAGWDLGTALFLGSVLGLSSTAIVAKLILDRFPGHDENFTSLMMVMVVEDVIAFLLALSFGFLFGVLSDYLGFSPAIGALLVGFFLPVKQSRYVREKILPLKDAFIVFFFLSMGTLIDTSSALSVGLPLFVN